MSAEAHEACEASEITDLNQLLISIRHIAVANGCAIFELDHGPPDYRIAIFGVLLVSNLMAIGIQRPSFQLGKEERA